MSQEEPTEAHKALLTIPQQIKHLKSKGVKFEICSESEAAKYLTDHTYYYKIAAYRTLFDKRVGGQRNGQYVNLDFGHLKALASLDRDFRYALLPLTLDVEHAARTKLVRIATEREDEDGYAISADYMNSLNHNECRRRENEIGMLGADAYCGAIVTRYGSKPQNMPIWVLMELFSFGSFTSLYLFCANRWKDRLMQDEHYMLRQTQYLRNACAHSSNLINGFGIRCDPIGTKPIVERALAKTSLSHRVRTAKMSNPRLKQITTLLYLHSHIVPNGKGKEINAKGIKGLKPKMINVMKLIPNNDSIQSSFTYLTKVIDEWF